MKILICSKLFYPSNAIGAVRPSNFAKYLNKFGQAVTVVTDEVQQDKDIGFQGIKIIRISNSKFMKCIMNFKLKYSSSLSNRKNALNVPPQHLNARGIRKISALTSFIQSFKISRRQIYDFIIEIDWYMSAKKKIKHDYNEYAFDIVISSFGPIESLLLGYFVSKSRIAKKWICDLRDPIRNENYPSWQNKFFQKIEKLMAQKSSAITTVSNGQVTMLYQSVGKFNFNSKKIFVIYNGFETKPTRQLLKRIKKILKISYTGYLYSNRSDFGMLFKVIDNLLNEQLIDSNRIVFCYAGNSSSDFHHQLRLYPKAEKICRDFGPVDRATAMEIQRDSDILVVLTWNNDVYQGVLTGKFMEYMQAYKPIISLTNGDLPNGELSRMVEKLNLGIACENITFENDYNRLREYLLKQYNHIQEGKSLIFDPKIEEVQKFHYETLSKELNEICLNLMSSK